MPIKNVNNEVNAVVKLVNRVNPNGDEITHFNEYDIQVRTFSFLFFFKFFLFNFNFSL